jgi:hypothetical protein
MSSCNVVDESYQKCAADNDEDTAALVAGLRVDRGNLVLDALEGKLLYSQFVSATLVLPVLASAMTYNPCFRGRGGCRDVPGA